MTAAVRKRVLVAGGGGFLGTHLCQRLLHAGHQVLCVDNFSSGSRRNLHQLNEFPSFSCIDHDIEQPLTADPVDEIYNFACVASKGHWELEHDGKRLEPVATPEHKTAAPSSVYALSKFDQERLCLMVGAAYRIPTVALRFFNIYGPRQALSNPYTGVLAIFSARYLNNRSPVVFEDGQQRRDFVSVHDVAKACVLALESNAANNEIFNVGSGRNYSITDIAHKVADAVGKSHIPPQITGQYRVGDIRHCFADITKAREMLCYQPGVSLSDGLLELADWLKTQKAEDRVDQMRSELAGRGLSL